MAESRKRKKQYYKNSTSKWSRRNEDLKPGVKGFIITCNDRERNAVTEGYRLLNEYADKKYGPEMLDASDSDCDDIEEALKKEVDTIKNANKKGVTRRFLSVQNKAKNVVFIKTNLTDPVELSTDIFNDILHSQIRKSKFCLRFLPVIDTCYAKPDHIVKAAKPLIEQHFHHCVIPFTFCIMWKVRCNNSLKREDVLTKLVDFIYSEDNGHKTDYTNPEVVFNLDIIGNICCFGILRNYHRYKKYNLDSLVSAVKKEDTETKDKADGDSLASAAVEKTGTETKENVATDMEVKPVQTESINLESEAEKIRIDANHIKNESPQEECIKTEEENGNPSIKDDSYQKELINDESVHKELIKTEEEKDNLENEKDEILI